MAYFDVNRYRCKCKFNINRCQFILNILHKMDFDRLRRIKIYTDQIKKFRNLEANKNISHLEFYKKMRVIFPKFAEEFPGLIKNIAYNKDLHILDIMFSKLNEIEVEFKSRINEVKFIKPFVKIGAEFLKDKAKVNKNRLINHLRDDKTVSSDDFREFLNKYPKIIERMVDDEFETYDPEVLLFEQIKFKHEVDIGEVLKKQYIDEKLNK